MVSVVFIYVFMGVRIVLDRAQQKQEVIRAHELWTHRKNKNYIYTVSYGCGYTASYRVLHSHGTVQFFFMRPGEFDGRRLQIDDIFEILEEAASEANTLEFRYASPGYPEYVKIDWSKDGVDDECFYQVQEFRDL